MKHQKQFHQIFSNCTLSIKISNQHRDFLTKFNISMKNSRNYAPSWKNVQFPHIYIYFFKFAPNVTNAIVIVCHKIDSLAISVNVKFQNDLRTKCPYRCLNVSSDCKFIYGVGQTPPQIFPNNFTAISFLRSWKWFHRRDASKTRGRNRVEKCILKYFERARFQLRRFRLWFNRVWPFEIFMGHRWLRESRSQQCEIWDRFRQNCRHGSGFIPRTVARSDPTIA